MGAERQRVDEGATGPAPDGTVEVRGRAAGDAGQALARMREVMRVVAEPPRPWPAVVEWERLLPAWFVEQCGDDIRISTCVVDRWSLRAWTWWFQPDQRRWTWWDARVEGAEVVVAVTPTDNGSLLLGALEWLMEAAGAPRVPQAGTGG